MQTNKTIPLYRMRSFGEKISATFFFLRQNWRLWLQMSCYLLLPLCMLQAFALNSMIGGIFDMGMLSDTMDDVMPSELAGGMGYLVSYVCLVLFSYVGFMIVASMMYAMMRYDREQPQGLQDATFRDLKDLFLYCLRRSLLMAVVLFFIALIFIVGSVLLAIASPWLTLAAVFLALFLGVALAHSLPVYLFEDDMTVFGSISRGFTLGWLTWGGTFLLLFIVGLLAGVLQGFTTLPWYIATIVKVIFMMDDNNAGFASSALFSFVTYILAVVQNFGAYITSAISVVALAYQYGSAAEQRDHFSVDEDIERFEEMTDSDDEIANFAQL